MKRLLVALLLASCGGEVGAPVHGRAYAELRPTDASPDELWRFDEGDVVEIHASPGGSFRVHFTRAGRNAVPPRDADGSGVPDYVEEVAAVYDEVLAFYAGRFFRAPRGDGTTGGDGRFDVYLLDFAHSADGAFVRDSCDGARCGGFIAQENDFSGYGYPSTRIATRILGSHELFHAVQAAYDDAQDVVFSEAGAVWASEAFDPSLPDLEGFAAHYLEEPSRSLDVPPPGPVPPFAYGAAIFFRFLEERFGEELIPALLASVEDGAGLPGADDDAGDPHWLPQLDALLARDHGSTFAEAFVAFATWNLYTDASADPSRAYADGAAYPAVAMEHATAPVELDRPRIFHASARYLSIDPAGRTRLLVGAVSPDPAELEGLWLLVARRTGSGIEGEPRLVRAGETVEVDAAERIVVAVVNGAFTGDSRRPSLCVGDAAEFAACAAARGAQVDALPPSKKQPDTDEGCASTGGPPSLLALALAASSLRRAALRRRT